MKVKITEVQRFRLRNLFSIYGVGGEKYTLGNHVFLQSLIEFNEYQDNQFTPFYEQVTKEVRQKVNEILEIK